MPFYVYGRDAIIAKFRALQELLGEHTSLESRICYAMKANPHAGILKTLKDEGAWIDAVSPNEVRTAMKAGFPASRVLYTGTSVSTADLDAVFGIDGLTVNIDAAEQLELMREVRDRSFRGKRVRVSVRWNPGTGRGFSPKAVTAGERPPMGRPSSSALKRRK